MLESARIACPHCGEVIDVTVDCSIEQQNYIEDCSVCCRPVSLIVACTDGALMQLEASAE